MQHGKEQGMFVCCIRHCVVIIIMLFVPLHCGLMDVSMPERGEQAIL
jgi:hypothetical protein